MKLTRKINILSIVIFIIINSCQSNNKGLLVNQSIKKNNKKYIRIHQNEKIVSIFPLHNLNESEKAIAQQVFEPLFRYNYKNQVLEKCLIDSFSIDSTKTKYNFTLKPNVFFHKSIWQKNNDVLSSDDVIFCLNKLCQNGHTLAGVIKTNKTSSDTSNRFMIQKIDDLRFSILLEKPNTLFLNYLSEQVASIYPALLEYNTTKPILRTALGTGPFKIDKCYEGQIMVSKNTKYHKRDSLGNSLPYLEKLEFLYQSNTDTAIQLFEEGKLDVLINLPKSVINQKNLSVMPQNIFSKTSHIIHINQIDTLLNDSIAAINQMIINSVAKRIRLNLKNDDVHNIKIMKDSLSIDSILYQYNNHTLSIAYDSSSRLEKLICQSMAHKLDSMFGITLNIKPTSKDSLTNNTQLYLISETIKNHERQRINVPQHKNKIIVQSDYKYYEVQPDIKNLSFDESKNYDFRTTFIKEIDQLTPKQ